MSTRLKRKLGELGVDTSSARANESFCLIGTPLPPLEKSKDNGEFVPLWKQDVRDEQGRRRLHGAFTGGFSAGYYNTVGSKEGWTPATFTSSRTDRAKQKVARPEDYMDEEDMADLKDAQDVVDTTEEMDLLGGTRVGLDREGEEDSVATSLAEALLPPPKDSVGGQILKKMGWRIGQGIGPRVTWRQRRLQDMEVSSGEGASADDIPEDDEEANKHTYAPRDMPVLLPVRKDNSHGLGYIAGMGLNESLGVKVVAGADGPKLSAGFGLGALNDAEDDDVDVYDGGLNHSRNRMAYDTSDRDDEDRAMVTGRSERGRHKSAPGVRSTSLLQTFHDGSPVLAGFMLSDKPLVEDQLFPLPDVPKGWTPNPRRVWDKDKENLHQAKPSEPPLETSTHGKWKVGISAEQRGTILGETPLPAPRRSVFEYISQKDRERLKNITPDSSGKASFPVAPTPTITIPHLETHVAQAALRGFQPFTLEPQKQTRYTAYLNSQALPEGASPPPPPPLPQQSIEMYNKELDDYAKAAMIFKPVSGAMASRFTSAAVVEHSPKVFEGLHTPSVDDYMAKEEQEQQVEKKVEESPKVHAARMGMYGPMTREVTVWIPNKLLCKRFGVKDPNPDVAADVPPPAGSVPGWQAGTSASAPEEDVTTESTSYSAQGTHPRKSRRRDLANVGLGDDDDQGRDILTYQRPTMDIFKAIFASDDEDSDDEEQKKDDEDNDTPPAATTAPPISTTVSSTPVVDSSQMSYEPSMGRPAAASPEKIDMGIFRPTFIPRDGKSKKGKDKEQNKQNKEKKKKANKVLVSFELDEDGNESTPKAKAKDKDKQRPKKKRRDRREGGGDDDDDSMWVEKPPPDVMKNIAAERPPELGSESGMESSSNKGRKRAIDFM